MVNALIQQAPVVGQAYGFAKTTMKVYNSTSPIEAVKTAAIGIAVDCTPPKIKYPIKCSIFIAQLGLAVSTGGNPWSVAMAIGSARQIIQ